MKNKSYGVYIFLVLTIIAAPLAAQQANQNINVLPVIPQQDASDDEWFKLGDGFLQRQVEPTIAVSTRNPDHLLAFFNDYRAVDIPNDEGLGEQNQNLALVLNTVDFMMAGLIAIPDLPFIQPPPMAAAEAWVGGSRSYDGGLTWSGFFMPGAPFDFSPASTASPVYGLEAATDPVAVAGPCGYVYVVFMGFTRGDQSKMVVARFQDLNNQEGGDTWEYQGTSVLEIGNNATNGYFLDKPHIALDVMRPASADQCAHRVYASYSTFNGNDANGNFRSKINFAASEDLGETWALTKIQQPYNQNQGSFIAVDPRAGSPKTTGGGTVYLVWRHFWEPDTILMVETENFGKKWSKPLELTGTVPMASFDQPTISTDLLNPDLLTFRSNGFPTATVTGNGTVFVAWQERVDIDPASPDFGRPSFDAITDSPRIVLVRSSDGGDTWTDIEGNPNTRVAVDFGDRDADPLTAPPAGFGALPDDRPSGPQVMPWLSFGGGRLALVYYESRGLLGGGDIGIQDQDISPATGFISGIDRVVDFRAALLNPSTGQLLGTTQVSRYPISASADLTNGEQVSDVAPVDPYLCSPDYGPGYPACNRQLNLMNKPQSGSGGSPFMGDYTAATPSVQFVYDEIDQEWRWATDAADVPNRAFHAIFADNRHLIPPTYPEGTQEWQRYQFYGPPEIGGACINPGSRNTDVLTARVNAELIVSAPTTFKQLNARRGFPIRVQNGTGVDRFYRLTITQGAADASFSSDPLTDLDTGEIQVYPYSSVSHVVYVEANGIGPFRVDVVEIDGLGGFEVVGGQSGSIVFNPDPNNPSVEGLGILETQNPFVRNPFVRNPFVRNPFVRNDGATNLSVSNPFVRNPFVRNSALDDDPNATIYDIVDTTWEIDPGAGTNTSSSYIPIINIDNAEQFLGNYGFQLIVFKTSTFAGYDEACEAYNLSQDQILSNVVLDPNDPENPFVRNPFVLNPFVRNENPENPFVRNPFVLNTSVQNATFTMAPPDGGTAAKATTTNTLQVADDGTLRAPRPSDTIKMTLRAFRLKPLCEELPEGSEEDCIDLVFDPTADPPSASVGSLPCVMAELNSDEHSDDEARAAAASACFNFYAPDLIPIGVDSSPIIAEAGGPVTFPVGGWTLRNQGTADATAENRALRHGFYLSADDTVDLDANGNPTGGDLLLHTESSGGPGTTIASNSDAVPAFAASNFNIPATVPEGDYNLILYVDDLEEVSELDEVNNKVLAKAPITVEAPNEPPVASSESFTATEDTPLSGSLTATDPQDDALTFSIVDQPSNGSVVLDDPTSGAFTYTPGSGFNGDDSFTFQANDGEFDSEIATATITVGAVNDAPSFSAGGNQTVLEDAGTQSVLWANDLDDGDDGSQGLTFTVTNDNNSLFSSQPAVASNGTLSYTPAADANGSATVSVTLSDNGGTGNGGADTSGASQLTISVTAVNDVPGFTKGADQIVGEDAGAQSVSGWATGLTAGPDDESGQSLTFNVGNDNNALFSAQPAIASDGTLTYTPADGQNGSASVTVTVSDDGGTADGGTDTSASQSFTITVNAVNDAPSFTGGGDQTVLEDAGAQGVPWATDLDDGDDGSQGLTFTVTNDNNSLFSAQPAVASNGTLSYTPAADANGSATVSVTLSDDGGTGNGGADTSNTSQFTITVTPVNDAPSFTKGTDQTVDEDAGAQTVAGWATGISAGPADESGQTVTFNVSNSNNALFAAQPSIDSAGSLTYTTALDKNGSATVTVSASDNGGTDNGGDDTSASQTFVITVNGVNDAPVVEPVELTINEDGSATGTLNVTDADGDTSFTYSVSSPPSDGTAGFSSPTSGFFTYTPNDDFNGADQFTVTVTDTSGDGGSATVTITITAQNDAPVVSNLSASTNEDTPVATTLSAIDVDGDDLTFTVVAEPANGALSGTLPNLTYTPNLDFTGTDTFTFQASDGALTSGTATFTVTVSAVNDPPVAFPDALVVDQNSGPNAINLLANDIDVDGDVITLLSLGGATNGVVAVIDGSVTYSPNVNFVGSDSFDYVINDPAGLTASAAVSVTVLDPVPDYGFLGLLEPWRPNNYRVNTGLSIPLKWYYTAEPGSEEVVDSAGALPLISIRGPFGCGPNDDDALAVEIVEDSGSSNLRNDEITFLWQFNWETAGLEAGCYNIRITSQETSQIDGPFRVQLR
jgi:VCBS repeat-containing protein